MFPQLNAEEWDWLVGFYLADGSKYVDKRSYCVYFYLNPEKDKRILKKLLCILRKAKLNPKTIFKPTINTVVVRVANKRLFNDLPPKNKKQNYFPTSPEAFIAGFLDGDGFINVEKDCIGFSQKSVKWVAHYISDYLTQKGVKSWFKSGLKLRNGTYYYRTSLEKLKRKTKVLKYMSRIK
jgi:hypothetical protein